MNKGNLPQVKNKNIFGKIKNWILKLFHKSKNEKDEKFYSSEKTYMNEKEKDFAESINISAILKLQNELKQNKISMSDLTDKELDSMIELYQKQVEEKEIKLKQYMKKISA